MPERQRLNAEEPGNLAKELKGFLIGRIKGQERAVKKLVLIMDLFQANFREADRPICTALFLGPSGVGKTLVAEVLAEFFFGSRNAFTKIACGDYREQHSISSLRGSPPGYVGYCDPDNSNHGPILSQFNIDKYGYWHQRRTGKEMREANEKAKALFEEKEKLTNLLGELKGNERHASYQEASKRIKRIEKELTELFTKYLNYSPANNYRSVILFDEIEKADRALHQLLLEILDKGKLTLANGTVTSFINSFIILTSNTGSQKIADILNKKKIGFRRALEQGGNPSAAMEADDLIYSESIKEASKVFPPEFLGRLDTKIVFRPLSRDNLKEILEIHLQNLCDLMFNKKSQVVLVIEEAVKEFIVDEAADRLEYGARLLKNKVQKYLKEPLSRLVNRGELKSGDAVRICLEDSGKKKIAFYKEQPS
ncbi:MAG: ATP-dependent Clp protease ATP-binding subunit [Candidatus Harrisonbacteria bacterium]|nr:ATP-dependent Clp protease ATP-binding subunit [Candidatus Harrisonbacteria bacterium]